MVSLTMFTVTEDQDQGHYVHPLKPQFVQDRLCHVLILQLSAIYLFELNTM
jgi:hypothetical protein